MSSPPHINLNDPNELPPIQQLALDNPLATAAISCASAIDAIDRALATAATLPNTAEDIEMIESQPPTPSADRPSGGYKRKLLSDFSITKDAASDDESVISSTAEELLTNRRDNLSAWKRAYLQSVLRVETHNNDHPSYAMWQQEAIDLERIVKDKTNEYERLQKAFSLAQPAQAIIVTPTVAAATVAAPDDKKLSLDNGTPRFGIPKPAKSYPFEIIQDPHLFLDSFHTYCRNSYGSLFLPSASRLLQMAILDEQTRQQMSDAISQHGESPLTWEECEVAFVNSVLTPTERFLTVKKVAEIGRRPKESYRNLSARLQRSVRIYRIDDKNAAVLSGLLGSLPSSELNIIKSALQKEGITLGEVKLDSLGAVLTTLQALEGPDDSVKRPYSFVDNDESISHDTFVNDKKEKRRKRNNNYKNNNINQDKSTPSESSVASSSKMCDFHGPNKTHDTKDCRICNKCNRRGHTAYHCKTEQKSNQDNKFSQKGDQNKKGNKP
ncbi:MAG: hypothetical protein JOS17DRAFT_792747 [Linnemannia elongata]|nr:MAG: hypothetical protein JOS17DRAFT_792747 [Linnemannia elongata]